MFFSLFYIKLIININFREKSAKDKEVEKRR